MRSEYVPEYPQENVSRVHFRTSNVNTTTCKTESLDVAPVSVEGVSNGMPNEQPCIRPPSGETASEQGHVALADGDHVVLARHDVEQASGDGGVIVIY